MKNIANDLVDEKRASQILGNIPVSTLRYWRRLAKGPSYYKLGRRIFYRISDLEAFIKANTVG